ncbi:unnamed protein product [Strongylus vulgaris]|uniref:Uncharacterized protein n=1 Tax=Strongylus vulgaris TaxID=40348 RepID=A0A3P7J7X2_STRVU|nr:unnamed protein product [Strongylus vulgaris]
MGRDKIPLVVREAKDTVEKLFNQTEKELQRTTTEVMFSPGELSWSHYTRGDRYSKYLSFSALISIETSRKLLESTSPDSRLFDALPLIHLDGSAIKSHCPVYAIEECIAGKYRTYSGHCNNVNHPRYGAVYEPLQRLLPPDYADKVDQYSGSSHGSIN